MDPDAEVDRWIRHLREELAAAGKTASEISRRIGASPRFLGEVLAGRRRLEFETLLLVLNEIGVTPGTFSNALYSLAGWRLDVGDRLHRPLLADLGEPVEGEPTWAELWQEALEAEARRQVDVRAELEALRKLLEARMHGRREEEAALEARAGVRKGALEGFLAGEGAFALADLFRLLGALEIPPASFFGDLYPVPGHERGPQDLLTPSWTEVLALADRLLAGIAQGEASQPAGTPAPADTPAPGDEPPGDR